MNQIFKELIAIESVVILLGCIIEYSSLNFYATSNVIPNAPFFFYVYMPIVFTILVGVSFVLYFVMRWIDS